jgi:hypothetical protein
MNGYCGNKMRVPRVYLTTNHQGIVALSRPVPWVHGSIRRVHLREPAYSPLSLVAAGRRKGDKDHWERATWFKTKLSATELFGAVQTAYEEAYAADGAWSPGSFHMESSGPLKAALRFNDRDGHHWQRALTVEPIAADTHQILLRVVTARAD